MNRIVEKKYINFLVLLCCAVYFVSYITRINYGAVLVEIISDKGITKAAASLVVTGSSITYGLGQLISGYLGDKMKPHLLMAAGLVTTAIMNLVFPFCSYGMMIAAWCTNGLAQAMMWPPMVKILTNYLGNEQYKINCVKVSWSASIGTIAVYLFAPVIIGTTGWEGVFFYSGIVAVIMTVILLVSIGKITSHTVCVEEDVQAISAETKKASSIRPMVLVLIIAAIGIILQGVLRDGITTWMPTYISDTYNLGSRVAILTGVVLPIFSIICHQLASIIYTSFIRNEFICAAVIFAVAFIASALLTVSGNSSAVLSVVLSAIVTGCMHGVNLILICMIPAYFEKYEKVSLISGFLNSCTYIGAAISTYGMAVVSDKFGWNATIVMWAVVALGGAIVCILGSKKWREFKKQSIKEMTH